MRQNSSKPSLDSSEFIDQHRRTFQIPANVDPISVNLRLLIGGWGPLQKWSDSNHISRAGNQGSSYKSLMDVGFTRSVVGFLTQVALTTYLPKRTSKSSRITSAFWLPLPVWEAKTCQNKKKKKTHTHTHTYTPLGVFEGPLRYGQPA